MGLFRGLSFRNFVDAVMLFGVQLERRGERAVIRVSRSLDRRRSLAWLVSVMEMNDFTMQVCETSDTDRVVYRTKPLTFLLAEMDRWYTPAQTMPTDIEVSEALLVTWSVSALANCGKNDIKFPHPIAETKTLEAIVYAANDMGWALECNGDNLTVTDRIAFENQVANFVPRAVWSPIGGSVNV